MNVFVTGGSGFLGRSLLSALVARGDKVRACARSEKATAVIRSLSAEPIPGDLSDIAALRRGMEGAEVVFHAAASVAEWEPWEQTYAATVTGTQNVMAAAKAANVRRVVHVSTEALLADGAPLVQVDEGRPIPDKPFLGYPRAKALAEKAALAANGVDLQVVVVRPRFIWGRDDTSLMEKFGQAVKDGRFMWIDHGRYLTSTCHVVNVCEGMLLAAERGKPGEVYFLTDGAPVEFRAFISSVLETRGIIPSDKSIPYPLASALATICEGLWRTFHIRSPPPVTRTAVTIIGREVTVSDAKARRELGYEGRMSREQGMAELR